jgi:tellurite methyltransferase
MKDLFSKNICRYRKEKNLTQEEFSKLLGISFQAVSKWERGQTMPDISLLPEISKVL